VPVHLSSLIPTGKTDSLLGPDENLQSAHSSPSSVASFRFYLKYQDILAYKGSERLSQAPLETRLCGGKELQLLHGISQCSSVKLTSVSIDWAEHTYKLDLIDFVYIRSACISSLKQGLN
jgi:primosomal replication protein N